MMNRPFAIQARAYFCICILTIVSMGLHGQDSTRIAATQAQITNVHVGAVPIAIPSPTDQLVEPGPDYRVIFEPLVPVNNRLVAAFVPLDKINTIHKGIAPPMDTYILIEVARQTEFTEIDSVTFQQIAEALGKQFGGDISQFSKTGQEEINHNLKALGNSTSVTIDKPVPLGIFFVTTNAIGVGSITPYKVNGVTTRKVGCLTLLRVRGHVLSLFTYSPYKDDETVTWVKTVSARWADAILKANEGPNGPSE